MIGSSLIHYFEHEPTPLQNPDTTTTPPIPAEIESLIHLAHRTIVNSSSNNNNNRALQRETTTMHHNNPPKNIATLIIGPSQSLKSSILMDASHAIASHPSCRSTICPAAAARADDASTTTTTKDTCRCCRVVVLAPKEKMGQMFPLKCRRRRRRRRHLRNRDGRREDNETVAMDEEEEEDDDDVAAAEDWNMMALKRIRIKYYSSIDGVVEYLSSIQSLPWEERPTGGIVIDDLDILLRSRGGAGVVDVGNNNGMTETSYVMKMMQILALLVNTGRYLQSIEKHSILLSCAVRQDCLPLYARRMVKQFIPIVATLEEKKTGGNGWNIQFQDDDDAEYGQTPKTLSIDLNEVDGEIVWAAP